MLRIGICDDNRNDLNRIHDLVSKTLFSVEEIQILEYGSGKELLKKLEEDPKICDLLLLDICMEPVDGMDTAMFIRDHKLDMDIIFITHSTEYVYRGYKYRAYAYIVKDRLEEDVPQELRRYVDERYENGAMLTIEKGGEKHMIPVSSVSYIESGGRILTVHWDEEDLSFYGKMSDIEDNMRSLGFIRIHQSYMVSARKIKVVRKDTVVLDDMTELPVSRKYTGAVKGFFDSNNGNRDSGSADRKEKRQGERKNERNIEAKEEEEPEFSRLKMAVRKAAEREK